MQYQQSMFTDPLAWSNTYACHCDGFRYKSKIGISLYFYLNQRHIRRKYLHPFWTPVYFTIPLHERKGGKLGQARALKGYFIGCSYSRYRQPCHRVVDTYPRIKITKDLIFGSNINFRSYLDSDLPASEEFSTIPWSYMKIMQMP